MLHLGRNVERRWRCSPPSPIPWKPFENASISRVRCRNRERTPWEKRNNSLVSDRSANIERRTCPLLNSCANSFALRASSTWGDERGFKATKTALFPGLSHIEPDTPASSRVQPASRPRQRKPEATQVIPSKTRDREKYKGFRFEPKGSIRSSRHTQAQDTATSIVTYIRTVTHTATGTRCT